MNAPGTPTLRAATPDDAPWMEACARRAYAPVLGRLEGLPDVTVGMAEEIRAYTALIARIGAQPAGFVIARFDETQAKVMNLACDPAFAGRGVAKALLDEIARRARDRGLARLSLVTHEGMPETLAFYRHLGWSEDGRHPPAVLLSRPV